MASMWKNTRPILSMSKRIFAVISVCCLVFSGCAERTSQDENIDIEEIQARVQTENEMIQENELSSAAEAESSGNQNLPVFTKSDIPEDVKVKMHGVTISDSSAVKFDGLSYLTLTYMGYDGKSHTGNMIVDKTLADEVISIFKELYEAKFPVEKIRLASEYGGDDELSMADNNTSAFNDRPATGGTGLSYHQLGRAIDINPKVNPYIKGNVILPEEGKNYTDRSLDEQGMISKDGVCVEIFKKYGWSWGGDWTSLKDYQHFEKK